MKVSVIVATFNQQDSIGRTLDSILAQRFDGDYEIIIGDDASTDSTEAVCRRYQALYPDKIVYLRRPENMGVVANYFDCIGRARGRYIADCAGDDYWSDPDKLQRQTDFLDANPDVSMVLTDWLCRDETSGELFRSPSNPEINALTRFEPGQLLPDIISGSRTLHLCSALYRKDLIANAVAKNPDIYTDPLYSCEDQQILLTMARDGAVAILPQVTLHYSVGHDSISHPDDAPPKFDYSYRALRQSLRLANHFDVKGKEVEKMKCRVVNHLAAMALRSGPQNLPDPNMGRLQRLRRFIRRCSLPVPCKARCYLAIMRCPPLWRLVNRLRK